MQSQLIHDIQHSHKAELLKLISELEVKADHYNRTDWQMYEIVLSDLADANLALLDIINEENEAFLQSIA